MLRCPNCTSPLNRSDREMVCPNGHRFDISKEGYVNLLVTHSTKVHGDEPRMVEARRTFLTQGHYHPLLKAVLSTLDSLKITSLVDLGCGEGAYTNAIAQTGIEVIGIDLSKAALKRAAKGSCATYVIANLTKTPLVDHSVEAALSIFSPFDPSEVLRITKRWFIVVRPLPEHLHEFKAVLYETVRPNPKPSDELPGFTLSTRAIVRFPMDLTAPSLQALLDMTPYLHTSPQVGIDRLRALLNLTVTAAFALDVFESCTPGTNPL